MSILPLDIVETIVDILAGDDPNLSSTKACSLVCHDFLDICQKRIFASIVLNNRYAQPPSPNFDWIQRSTTPKLQRLLSDKPEFADYIRDLRYCITPDDLQDPTLMQTFEKITRLRFLSITTHLLQGQLDWSNNPLYPALLRLLQLSSITRLTLYGIENFIVTDLTPCINLEHLDFECLTALSTSLDSSPELPDSSIGLRTMSVGAMSASTITQLCAAQCANGKPFIDFSMLAGLSMEVLDSPDVPALQKLLSLCRRLVDVRIEVLDARLSLIGLSNHLIPSLQTLKHIFISTIFSDFPDLEAGDDPLCGLANELEKMGNNVIEGITIKINISTDSECTRGDEWGRLDQVLSQSGWSHLRRVALLIIVGSHAREDELEEELQELPVTQFKWLSANTSVVFEFEVRSDWV